VCLWPLTCRDCRFESHRGHGYLFLVSVLCCVGRDLYYGHITQSEDSEPTALGWPKVRRYAEVTEQEELLSIYGYRLAIGC